ncbi:MAG: RuBisCO large subunit C-terminal-like domain-containing protein [Planctomycetota bacterium]
MNPLDEATLNILRTDLDDREERIRRIVYDALAELSPPDLSEHVVASYFVVARSMGPARVGREIAYHMTSGVRTAPPGSLLAACSGEVVDAVSFDPADRIGIVRVAFPLAMLLDAEGEVYSTDLLHITAGAGVFALTEHADVKLVDLAMSDDLLRRFPGPAHGAPGVRKLTSFPPGELAFGTILKPCTGITPEEEAEIVAKAAANPMFLFVKEDENFLPGVAFAPLEARLRLAMDAVRRAADRRDGRGLIYAPHVTSPPERLAENVRRAIDAGANGIMLSEYYVGGAVRMVRDMTADLPSPPAIYGHNGGITVRTRHIWREVLDLLARLDGIDFRQTAPLSAGRGLLRPNGLEWRACEQVLSRPLAGHPPVMMARAGGLDQGNIIPNLLDVASGAGADNYLFLAGSAINGIKNRRGEYDPALGAEAMQQAVQVFREGVFVETTSSHPAELKSYADSHGLEALSMAITERYDL